MLAIKIINVVGYVKIVWQQDSEKCNKKALHSVNSEFTLKKMSEVRLPIILQIYCSLSEPSQ